MPSRITLALLAAALASPAVAQGVYREFGGGGPYAPAYGGGYGSYGFANEFVRGDYIGAPLTRFPSPLRIVPTPWSYGTYGVPTVSGIPPAPVAQPTITLINASARRPAGRGGWTEADRTAGARVIEVQVPRR